MMFSSNYSVYLLLTVIQVLAALPWLALLLFKPEDIRRSLRNLKDVARLDHPSARGFLLGLGVAVLAVLVAPLLLMVSATGGKTLTAIGYCYGVVLQFQLLADLFILVFVLLLGLWPKGGAIALAAFREGVRQPMFWLLFAVAFVALAVSPLIPYFTFGEDHLVVKEIGIDTIMLAAAVFAALAASMSISEEIEGRTAVTVMSKPVSRRHFLIGKFVGIVLAAAVMFVLLGTFYEGVILFKVQWWERNMDPEPTPLWILSTLEKWALPGEASDLMLGVGLWTHLTLDTAPGLILAFSQVMVLAAIAVSLATRVPMVVNLVAVVVIFFLAHLTPVLVSIGYEGVNKPNPGAGAQILNFMAQLFDLLLPNLESFRLEPALLNETPISAGDFAKYLGSVSLYGLLYTSIVLLFGLILFEDRDLA
ncbi:MAG TPA: ABC transporter permease subunit [Gemmataceae bacterium]|jgi:hypothetical protein